MLGVVRMDLTKGTQRADAKNTDDSQMSLWADSESEQFKSPT